LKLAPAIGEAVAAMVLDETAPIDIRPLRMQRFADGEPMYLAYGPGARG
jgi:glycine/D-amino acid oxidase-like deaminating enzyme